MIKPNTLPELPHLYAQTDKKKKNKKRDDSYNIHISTSNKSFIKMYRNLSALGVENNDFFLALYDERLEDVDPYDPDLTDEEKVWILSECKINYWYFIREVVRLPVPGADIGDGIPYELNRGNLAISWCFIHNFNFFAELPRQNGKSVAIDLILLWLHNFGTTNSSMLLMNKDHNEAKNNLKRIREFRDVLPKFMRFNTRYAANGTKELKLLENKEDAYNPKTKNSLITKPCATSKDKADLLGRGMTQPVQWYDEFAFLKYNMIIYEAASPAAGQAALEAEKFGKPHCKMITTTPGDRSTEYGEDAYQFKLKCCTFREDFYDWNDKDVKELLSNNSDNDFFNIIFSWQQLGRDMEYYKKCVKDLNGNYTKIRREVLLQWITIVGDSPFDEKDLSELQEITYNEDKIARPIYIDNYFKLNLYEAIEKGVPIIISCDVASGVSRDSSTISLINSRNKHCIGEFNNNKVDTLTFSYIIHTVATKLCPDSVIVIERNNVGASVITNLLKTDVRSKLYLESNANDMQQKIKDGHVVGTAVDIRNYGVYTDETKRDQMHELLSKFVKNYRERIRTPLLSQQTQDLIYNKRGKVDHRPDGHDDSVMSYLIGIWVLYYGKSLSKYGIVRLPDVDKSTGMTEEEVLAQEILKQHEKENNLAKTSSEISREYEDNTNNTVEFKTMNDYYNEIDEEREYYYDKEQGLQTKTPLSKVINNNTNNSNRIDLLRQGANNGSSIFSSNDTSSDFGNDLLCGYLDEDF